jgi:hypothetical protein
VDIDRVDVLDPEKLERKHNVRELEVQQIFANEPYFRFSERGRYEGEDVYVAFGQTDGGRYLVVFFIHKLTRVALVLSARDMDAKERRQYGRR